MARLMGAMCAAFAIISAVTYSATAQTALPDIVVTVRREQPKSQQPRRAAPTSSQPSTGQRTAVPAETNPAGPPIRVLEIV
jgi:hypothetical protein